MIDGELNHASSAGAATAAGRDDIPDERKPPLKILHAALAAHPRIIMTSGFNLNGVVLLDLAVRAGFRGEVVFVDTGGHFPETLETRDGVARRYPEVSVVTLRPEGDELPECGADECCARRKVAPLLRFLEERRPEAMLTARSRFQGESRAHLPLLEPAAEPTRVNPLAYRSRAELESYARRQRLPLNPLYARNFLSIGCAATTRAVRSGETLRAGRWAGQGRSECGLWQDDASP